MGGRLSLIPAELDAFFEPHSRGCDPERVCSWLCDAGIDKTWQAARPLTKLISFRWRLEERLRRGELHSEPILGELGVPAYTVQAKEKRPIPWRCNPALWFIGDTVTARRRRESTSHGRLGRLWNACDCKPSEKMS
jgi:hypothetical protein